MSDEMKVFWITKYALSTGIMSKPCRIHVASPERCYASSDGGIFCLIGADAFDTEAAARENAIVKAKRKLKSFEKKAADLAQRIKQWSTPEPSKESP